MESMENSIKKYCPLTEMNFYHNVNRNEIFTFQLYTFLAPLSHDRKCYKSVISII